MEYVNPTSIAQMAQVPKDTSLPGTGYGLMQGWKEGEAMAKAKDFLSLSQAAQAQDYAKQQFDMQSKWQDRPQTLQQNAANLEQTQLGNQKTKWDISQAHQTAKRDNVMGQLRVVGAFSPQLREAKTPMERMALYENMRRQIERQGFQLDPDLNYDPNDPESWNNILKYASAADVLTVYDRKFGQEQRLQTSKQDWASKEGALDRASRELMNKQDNDARIQAERIQAWARQQASSGTESWQAAKVQIFYAVIAAKKKKPEELTPEDKAILEVGPGIISGSAYSTDQRLGRAGEVAEATAEGTGRGKAKSLKFLKDQLSGRVVQPGNALPPQPSLNEEPLPANPGSSGGFNGKVIKYDSKGNRIQ